VKELSKRSAQEVLDHHLGIANRWGPDEDIERIVEEDLRRNVAEDCDPLQPRYLPRPSRSDATGADAREELPEHGAFQYICKVAEGRTAPTPT
jgi:serine/threonine protein kinase HipA of HipAB toxin-antitoxin module